MCYNGGVVFGRIPAMTKPPVIVRKVIGIGNSIGVTIDRTILDQAGIKPGNWVEVRPGKRKGTLVVRKIGEDLTKTARPKSTGTPDLTWYV